MALVKNFTSPALPLPAQNYDVLSESDKNRTLRLYFNQLDNFLNQVLTEINDMQVPFYLKVAQGVVTGYSSFTVFGYNPDVDQTEESIWPDGSTVPHPTSESQLTIASTDANDAAAGTGARTVYIEGLDEDYEVVSETVTLNGTSGVTTTNSYIYVNQFYVVTVGSGGANAGDITAKVSTTLYDIIAAGNNQRTTGHYCVPAGYTGYLLAGSFTCGQPSGSTAVTGYLKSHGPDGILRAVATTTLNNGQVQYDFEAPIKISEKFCVGASAVGQANNNTTSCFFNIMLVQNDA